jgi:hypothetical protein
VKRSLAILLLLLASPSAFSQARQNTFVYMLDVLGGTAGERRFFTDSLRMEIPAAGYALTGDILAADYALSCAITEAENGSARLLVCSLLDPHNETELATASLLYDAIEETYEMLPSLVRTVFSGAPLKQGAGKETAENEMVVPVYLDARGPPEEAGVLRCLEKPPGVPQRQGGAVVPVLSWPQRFCAHRFDTHL